MGGAGRLYVASPGRSAALPGSIIAGSDMNCVERMSPMLDLSLACKVSWISVGSRMSSGEALALWSLLVLPAADPLVCSRLPNPACTENCRQDRYASEVEVLAITHIFAAEAEGCPVFIM